MPLKEFQVWGGMSLVCKPQKGNKNVPPDGSTFARRAAGGTRSYRSSILDIQNGFDPPPETVCSKFAVRWGAKNQLAFRE